MTEKVKGEALYRDVIAAPEDKIAEIVEGNLYLSPRPTLRHGNAASALLSDLNDAFQRGRSGPGGWWILFEPELHLTGDVLVPDIAGWRRERLPELPEGPGVAIAPEWLCEVLSPSTESFDRGQKLPRYATGGVDFLWLVDPLKRRLEVYGREKDQWLLMEEYSGNAVVSAPPFELIAVDLAPLWVP